MWIAYNLWWTTKSMSVYPGTYEIMIHVGWLQFRISFIHHLLLLQIVYKLAFSPLASNYCCIQSLFVCMYIFLSSPRFKSTDYVVSSGHSIMSAAIRYPGMALTHCPLGRGSNFSSLIFKFLIQNSSLGTPCLLNYITLLKSQDQVITWCCAVRQQTISWTSVDQIFVAIWCH